MGYQRKVLKLVFEDKPELVVFVRSVNVRRVLRLMQLAATLQGGEFTDMAEAEAVIAELFGAFTDRVQSWTLADDEDKPVPVSLDALLDWDFDDAMLMVLAWLERATSVLVPTAPPADGTGNPLEASIPMASASGM